MKNTLICTVGTSLIYPNLSNLPKNQDSYESWLTKQNPEDRQFFNPELILQLRKDFDNNNLKAIANGLNKVSGKARLCGAEINSIVDIIEKEYCQPQCQLIFCHSETPDGLKISQILQHYFEAQKYSVTIQPIEGLRDDDPKRFRTKGLRNLAKEISQYVRDNTPQYCAINATGGYKAQIAIAVLIGQALGIPVYYKHERFSEIISFPPMPIGLDFDLWLKASGWLTALDRKESIRYQDLEGDWTEQLETLVNRVEIEGEDYLELSPTGQIFHETFKGRFTSERDQVLPPPVQQKIQPHLTDHDWKKARTPILNYLEKIIKDCSYVYNCRTYYWNPDLSSTTLFRLKGEEIEGILSNGTWTVKFIVDTSAKTQGQKAACIADLNLNFNT